MSSWEVEALDTDAESADTADADGKSDADGKTGADATAGTDADAETDASATVRGRLRGRLPSVGIPFSPKRFGLAVGLITVGIVAGGWIPFVGAITQYVGLFGAAFLLGATGLSGYLETGAAGAAAAGLSTVLGLLTTGTFVIGVDVLQRYGLAVAGVGVSIGLLVSLIGLYFGRDFKDGLTRSL